MSVVFDKSFFDNFKSFFLKSRGSFVLDNLSIIDLINGISNKKRIFKNVLLQELSSTYYLMPESLSEEEKNVFKSSPWFLDLKVNLKYPDMSNLSLYVKSPNSLWKIYLKDNKSTFLIFQENEYITELKLPYKVKSFCVWDDYLILVDEDKVLRIIYLYSLKEVFSRKNEKFDKVFSDNDSIYVIYENNIVQSFKVDETGIKFEDIVSKDIRINEEKEVYSFNIGGGIVNSLSFSPDGKYLAVSKKLSFKSFVFSTDNFTKIFKEKYKEYPNYVQFSPDGKYLAVGCGNGYVYMYDVSSNFKEVFKERLLNGWIVPVVFSQDSKYFALGGVDYFAVFELNSKNKLFESLNESIQTISFSPSAEYIAVGNENNKVKVFNIKGDLVKEFDNYAYSYNNLHFSPDGKYLAYATKRNKIDLISVDSWKKIDEIDGEVFTFSKDSKYIVSGIEGKVIIWDTENFNKKEEIIVCPDEKVISIDINPISGVVACGDRDGYIYVIKNKFLTKTEKIIEKKVYELKKFLWYNPYLIFLTKENKAYMWMLDKNEFVYKSYIGIVEPSEEFKDLNVEGWKVDDEFILIKDGKVAGSKGFKKYINVSLGGTIVNFEDFKDIILTKPLEVLK